MGSEFSHPLDNRGGLQNLVGTMEPLEPPDTHYLSAALGWLELGNAAESICELGQIRPENVNHPDVLEVRWMVLIRPVTLDGTATGMGECQEPSDSHPYPFDADMKGRIGEGLKKGAHRIGRVLEDLSTPLQQTIENMRSCRR